MSDGDLIVIFHYDGDFEFDIIRPLYKGGKQKTRLIKSDITFNSLVNITLKVSNWEETCDNISMDYLHHNGHMFTLILAIKDDNDIRCMLSLSGDDTNGIYLYVRRRLLRFAECLEEQARSYGTEKILIRDNKFAGIGSSHNAKRKVTYGRDTLHPTVNFGEDYDVYFLSKSIIGSDEVGQNSGGFLQEGVDMAEMDEAIQVVDVESGNPGNSADVSASRIVRGLETTLNVREHSIHRPEVIFEDNMALEEFNTDLDQSAPWEMWVGREFSDRKNFRRSLAKFANTPTSPST